MDDGVGLVFAALADPTRRRVVRELGRRGPVTATELARSFPISRQAVAKHLAVLGDAGLVEGTRSGRETRYRLTPAPLADVADWMADVDRQWAGRLAALGAYAERRATSD